MCWTNYMATPIVLKKPLRVYKVGTSTNLGNFLSLYQGTLYYKHKIMPTVKVNPKFIRCYLSIHLEELWNLDIFYIHEGYHSYLTEKMARYRRDKREEIGIFEIPAGATIYVDYGHREVVSTNIRYLGLLK